LCQSFIADMSKFPFGGQSILCRYFLVSHEKGECNDSKYALL